jgi:hypothetical protein
VSEHHPDTPFSFNLSKKSCGEHGLLCSGLSYQLYAGIKKWPASAWRLQRTYAYLVTRFSMTFFSKKIQQKNSWLIFSGPVP